MLSTGASSEGSPGPPTTTPSSKPSASSARSLNRRSVWYQRIESDLTRSSSLSSNLSLCYCSLCYLICSVFSICYYLLLLLLYRFIDHQRSRDREVQGLRIRDLLEREVDDRCDRGDERPEPRRAQHHRQRGSVSRIRWWRRSP